MDKPAPNDKPDASEDRSADRVRTLEHLAELSMSAAERIERLLAERRSEAPPPSEEDVRNMADLDRQVVRLKRGARLSLALRDRILASEAKARARQAKERAREAAGPPLSPRRRSILNEALVRRALAERASATVH